MWGFSPKIKEEVSFIYTNRSWVKFSGSERVETVNHTSQWQTQWSQLQRWSFHAFFSFLYFWFSKSPIFLQLKFSHTDLKSSAVFQFTTIRIELTLSLITHKQVSARCKHTHCSTVLNESFCWTDSFVMNQLNRSVWTKHCVTGLMLLVQMSTNPYKTVHCTKSNINIKNSYFKLCTFF